MKLDVVGIKCFTATNCFSENPPKKVLECEGNSGEFVELVPEQLNYLGPKDLTQYFIRSYQKRWD